MEALPLEQAVDCGCTLRLPLGRSFGSETHLGFFNAKADVQSCNALVCKTAPKPGKDGADDFASGTRRYCR